MTQSNDAEPPSVIYVIPGPPLPSGDLDDPEYVAELNSRHEDCPCGEDCPPDNCIYWE